jgi:hypothetical protein
MRTPKSSALFSSPSLALVRGRLKGDGLDRQWLQRIGQSRHLSLHGISEGHQIDGLPGDHGDTHGHLPVEAHARGRRLCGSEIDPGDLLEGHRSTVRELNRRIANLLHRGEF